MIGLRHGRPLVLAAALCGVALASATPVFAATEPLVQISSDPYTNPTSQHKTQVEPDTLSWGSTIVSVFQTGRFFNGGASNIGYSTSLDRGRTWHRGFLPYSTVYATPPGAYGRASDASVAYDPRDKVWMTSWLGLQDPVTNKVDLLVSRSTDGGLTFGKPVVVNASGDFNDKNWTVCDTSTLSSFYGNCYTEFDDNTLGDLEQMSTSSDGGLTWGAAKPTADGAHGIGGQPLVRPNGEVVVPYINLDFGDLRDFISTDGGVSWSASTFISSLDFHAPNGGIRAGLPLPSAEIDSSGRIYVVWSDCRFEAQCNSSDLLLSTSDDGLLWSAAHRIPTNRIGSGADYFIPGLAVDRSTPSSSARLALAYYFYPQANCGPATCQLEVGFITSTNGGTTWSSAETLVGPMSLSWLADTSQGRMVGDYISTSISPGSGTASPVFAKATAPNGATFNEAMFTVREDAGAASGGASSTAGDRPAVNSAAPRRPAAAAPPTAF